MSSRGKVNGLIEIVLKCRSYLPYSDAAEASSISIMQSAETDAIRSKSNAVDACASERLSKKNVKHKSKFARRGNESCFMRCQCIVDSDSRKQPSRIKLVALSAERAQSRHANPP